MADTREQIMAEARTVAQAHGYNGLSFRELAKAVGVKSASIHYHFPTKGDLGAALARRYREDARAMLGDPAAADPWAELTRYAAIFRQALERANRMCLCGIMAAEHDDLPVAVRVEVTAFADENVEWLGRVLALIEPGRAAADVHAHAMAIYAALGGAQLAARGRGDIAVYDSIVETYRQTGLIPVRAG